MRGGWSPAAVGAAGCSEGGGERSVGEGVRGAARLSVHERLVAGLCAETEELERGYLRTLGALSLLSVLGSCQ